MKNLVLVLFLLPLISHGQNWIQVGSDIDGEAAEDQSGSAVSLEGNRVAIGAFGNDGNGAYAGHARVFSIKGVFGSIYQDYNQNCIQENNEISGAS